jgi:hypothetical protein
MSLTCRAFSTPLYDSDKGVIDEFFMKVRWLRDGWNCHDVCAGTPSGGLDQRLLDGRIFRRDG